MDIKINKILINEVVKTEHITDIWSLNNNFPSGDINSPNFINSPQHKLTLDSSAHLQIKLETTVYTPIMICLIAIGKPLNVVPYEYILNNQNPGVFFSGFSYFECFLDKGEYNIVCVSQDVKIIGEYKLEVNVLNSQTKLNIYENISLSLKRIEINNYTFTKDLIGEWNKTNSKGGVITCPMNRFN